MTSPPSASPKTPSDARTFQRPRPGGARVIVLSLAASILLHALAVVLYMVFIGRMGPPTEVAAPPGPAVRPQGVEVVRIAEIPAPASEEVEEPETPETPEPAAPEPAAPEPGPEGGEEAPTEERVPSVAERLRPPERGDPRIWRPVNPALTELTPEQRARLRVYARIQQLADSLLTEEERARAARDWTYTDEEGNRWGLADGKIYLGETVIPFPFNFSGPPSVEGGQLQWEWDDTQRGAQDAAVYDSWEERSEAIRERRDAERADTSGTGGGRE